MVLSFARSNIISHNRTSRLVLAGCITSIHYIDSGIYRLLKKIGGRNRLRGWSDVTNNRCSAIHTAVGYVLVFNQSCARFCHYNSADCSNNLQFT